MEDRLVTGLGSYHSSVALVNLPNKHYCRLSGSMNASRSGCTGREVLPNNTLERTGGQRGRAVLAKDCGLGGQNWRRARPLNAIVRQH